MKHIFIANKIIKSNTNCNTLVGIYLIFVCGILTYVMSNVIFGFYCYMWSKKWKQRFILHIYNYNINKFESRLFVLTCVDFRLLIFIPFFVCISIGIFYQKKFVRSIWFSSILHCYLIFSEQINGFIKMKGYQFTFFLNCFRLEKNSLPECQLKHPCT